MDNLSKPNIAKILSVKNVPDETLDKNTKAPLNVTHTSHKDDRATDPHFGLRKRELKSG